jgi:hypothetical protein
MSRTAALKIARLTHQHSQIGTPEHQARVADVLAILGMSPGAALPGVAELADMLTTVNRSVGEALIMPYVWG